MDLVNLTYKYVNRFINSEELIKGLESIDLSKYSDEEIDVINKLILDVKNIKETTPNEVDEIEIRRMKQLNYTLEKLEGFLANEKNTEEANQFLKKECERLSKDKEIIRDGGKLYNDIFNLLTSNSLYKKYCQQMNDEELLDFIAQYISAPMPPKITQETFNDLVSAGIKQDKREALWRLAFNYYRINKDFSLIEDYFIEKRDHYYLLELISAVSEDLDLDKLIDKIFDTNDKDFINTLVKNGVYVVDRFTDEQINRIKNAL